MENEFLLLKIQNGQNGVFSKVAIQKGDHIIDFCGKILDKQELPDSIESPEEDRFVQISKYKFLGPSGKFDDFINHSCNPNSGLHINNNQVALIAIKDIKKDEEITWDYSTTMFDDNWIMKCACDSANCRGVIKEFKFLPAELKQRYMAFGVVPTYNMGNIDTSDPRQSKNFLV